VMLARIQRFYSITKGRGLATAILKPL